MPSNSPETPLPPGKELRDLYRTVSGSLAPSDYLASRLGYAAALMAEAGRLPAAPLLAWREEGGPVRHLLIGQELVIGRQTPEAGLSLAGDDLLSRQHFVVRVLEGMCQVEDLNSRNGTAVNHPENRVRQTLLHDGDQIYAGKQVFVFLTPPMPASASAGA